MSNFKAFILSSPVRDISDRVISYPTIITKTSDAKKTPLQYNLDLTEIKVNNNDGLFNLRSFDEDRIRIELYSKKYIYVIERIKHHFLDGGRAIVATLYIKRPFNSFLNYTFLTGFRVIRDTTFFSFAGAELIYLNKVYSLGTPFMEVDAFVRSFRDEVTAGVTEEDGTRFFGADINPRETVYRNYIVISTQASTVSDFTVYMYFENLVNRKRIDAFIDICRITGRIFFDGFDDIGRSTLRIQPRVGNQTERIIDLYSEVVRDFEVFEDETELQITEIEFSIQVYTIGAENVQFNISQNRSYVSTGGITVIDYEDIFSAEFVVEVRSAIFPFATMELNVDTFEDGSVINQRFRGNNIGGNTHQVFSVSALEENPVVWKSETHEESYRLSIGFENFFFITAGDVPLTALNDNLLLHIGGGITATEREVDINTTTGLSAYYRINYSGKKKFYRFGIPLTEDNLNINPMDIIRFRSVTGVNNDFLNFNDQAIVHSITINIDELFILIYAEVI